MTTKSSCPFELSTNLVKIVSVSLSLCFEFGTIVEKVVYFAKMSYTTAELWLDGAYLNTACDTQSWQGAWNVKYFAEKSGNFLIFLFKENMKYRQIYIFW